MQRRKQKSPGGSSSPLDGATAGGGLATTTTLAPSQTSSTVDAAPPATTAVTTVTTVDSRGSNEAPPPGIREGGVDGAMVQAYHARSPPTPSEQLRKTAELLEWASSNSDAIRGDVNLGQDYFDYQHAYLLTDVNNACRAANSKEAWKNLWNGWKAVLECLVALRNSTKSKLAEEAKATAKAEENRRKTEEGNRRAAEEARQKAEAEAARKLALRRAYDEHMGALRRAATSSSHPEGKAVSLARNANGDEVIGVSGRQARNFERRSDGSVVYIRVRESEKTAQIKALEQALSHPSYEQNREVWDCAEVDAAVQIALDGGNFNEYRYLSIIKEESSPDYHYLQTCLNCTHVFSEPPRA